MALDAGLDIHSTIPGVHSGVFVPGISSLVRNFGFVFHNWDADYEQAHGKGKIRQGVPLVLSSSTHQAPGSSRYVLCQ